MSKKKLTPTTVAAALLVHYILSDPESGWQAEFDIDLAKAPAACKESLDFFGDPVMREDDTPEEIIRAFLKFWGPALIGESMKHGRNDGQPQDMVKAMGRLEGIIALDGSHGITLTYCERLSFDPYQFEVTDGAKGGIA